MADVFHFNSPREPAPLAKHRPAFRRRANVRKTTQGRSVNVNMFTQRACVARYNEPVFCPSDASSLLFPGSLTTATRDLDMRYDMEHYLDDDDEVGGVPLPPLDDDAMMDDGNDLHEPLPTVHTSHVSVTSDDTLPRQHQLYFEPTPTASGSASNILRPNHPRPETRDIWEEEDGRRLRLALDGDGPDEEPRFAFPPSVTQTFYRPQERPASRPESRISRAASTPSTATSRLSSRRASSHDMLNQAQTQANVPGASANGTVHLETPWDQPNMEMSFDEDALAVDDPRRNYDFGDFMDLWRLLSVKDRRLPRFEPGLQSSIRLGRPEKPVLKKDIASGSIDMQGIRWKVIGPSREDALTARERMHPSPKTVSAGPDHSRSHKRRTKHYQFRSFAPGHKAKFSHYQLRNALGATSRNELFYTTGSQVKRTSLACPDLHQTVMDVSKAQSSTAGFRITCLSAAPRQRLQNRGILVAGGFFGEYALCNVDLMDGAFTEGFVTHAYNGLVTHIHTYANRRSGLPQAVFCSNDRMVRVMDVSTLNFTSEFGCENAINCSSTSPDGRLRVLVGDSQETLITNAETGQTLVTLREHGDHGFACDWSGDGLHVATAAQDGGILIWDARNWTKPCKSWTSSVSCARSVQFTDTGALVVAENDDIMRVYDGAKGHHHQEIDFFGSIAGVALVDGGEELVIANADKTVGGLMSFERTAQGFGETGSFGREVDRKGFRGREWMNEFVADIVV